MRNEVNVNANILTWAIARAGYELQAFTEKYPKLNIELWLESRGLLLRAFERFAKDVAK